MNGEREKVRRIDGKREEIYKEGRTEGRNRFEEGRKKRVEEKRKKEIKKDGNEQQKVIRMKWCNKKGKDRGMEGEEGKIKAG